MDSDLIVIKARDFVELHHRGETRKFGNTPYFVHPERVAKMMEEFNQSAEIIAAAYLHDIIENTPISYDVLLSEFGQKIADLVLELTSDKTKYDKSTKAQYLAAKMQEMNQDALTIKLADRLDNVSGLSEADETFTKRYVNETKYILDHLSREFTDVQKILVQRIKECISPFL